jgi:hypothetical protein
LPAQGDPLLAVTTTPHVPATCCGSAVWTCGPPGFCPNWLVAWSLSHPVRVSPFRQHLVDLAAPLCDHDIVTRVRGTGLTSFGKLPAPGQALLVDIGGGVAYWRLRGALLRGPVLDDGIVGFDSVAFVAAHDADLSERIAIDHADGTLRQASAEGVCTWLYLPSEADRPRDVHLCDLAIQSASRTASPARPTDDLLALHLVEHFRRCGDGVVLDRTTALALAAEVIAHPAAPHRRAARVPHAWPDFDDGTVAIWRAATTWP